MASRQGRGPKAWSEPMLDAAYEWAADLATTRGMALQVSMTPTPRLGVWKIYVRALYVVDGKPAGIACQTGAEWPDASYGTLGAKVFELVSRLATDLAMDALTGK